MKRLYLSAAVLFLVGCASASTASHDVRADGGGSAMVGAGGEAAGGGGTGGLPGEGGKPGAGGEGGGDGGMSGAVGGSGGEGGTAGGGGVPDPPDPCALPPAPTCIQGGACSDPAAPHGFQCDAAPGMGCVPTGGAGGYCCPNECMPSHQTNNLCYCGYRSWVCHGSNWPAPSGCYAQGQIANLTCCVAGAPF